MSSYSVRSNLISKPPEIRGLDFRPRRPNIHSTARDDSDDENMLGPPTLSNFGSALLSDKENVEPHRSTASSRHHPLNQMSRTHSQLPSRTETLAMSREFSTANTNSSYTGPHSTIHSVDHSDSTLFATFKDNQQSMTTFNPDDQLHQSGLDRASLEQSRSKIKSLQQALRDDLSSRNSKRRTRRFASSRLSLLGPAKRASSTSGTPNRSELIEESNISQPEGNISNSSTRTASANLNEHNIFYEPQNSNEAIQSSHSPFISSTINYEDVEFGDLNPYQYLKKHNLPTTELPNISRIYFERQKGQNRKAALRKSIASKDAIQNRIATTSSPHSPPVDADAIRRDNSASKRQPRRKISESATSNDPKAWSSPFSGSNNPTVASARRTDQYQADEKYRNTEIPDTNAFDSFRRREALSNININSYSAAQPQHKKPKYSDYNPQEFGRLPRPSLENRSPISNKEEPQFKHRSPPLIPGKHVEIVEPIRTKESIPLKPPASSDDINGRKRPIVYVNGTEYEKLELLGRGGTSKVYKVKNANNNKVYALKRVSFDEFDDSSIDGFKGEIELLKKLETQPRVVKLIDHEMDHGVLYVVMECGDHDLSQTLAHRSGMPLDVEFVRYHAQEMLKCVKVVHDAGIVHSDLKPANFVFVKGILKIIDFGIANAVPEHTVNIYRETQIGTPNYMAPEALVAMNYTHNQAPEQSRWKVGKPSDIWSCGCIIYQMIYGRPPYGGFQGQNRLLAIMNPEVKIVYPEKTSNGDTVPKTAIDTMKACLERNPNKRWTVEEVANGSFVKPVSVTHFFIRDLIENSVRYGANQKEISSAKVEELAEDVWHRLEEFRL